MTLPPMSEETKDMASRAAWTFAQAFLGVLVAIPVAGWTVGLLVAAVAAGIAASLSVVKTYVSHKVNTSNEV